MHSYWEMSAFLRQMPCSTPDRARHQEPDLYYWNGKRPGLKNYTVDNYVEDYNVVFNQLKNTSNGDILAENNIGGPTICCAWVMDGFGTIEPILTQFAGPCYDFATALP